MGMFDSFFNQKEKTNWEKLSSMDNSQKMQYRDVYADQQLDRSNVMERKSPTSRIIISAAIAIFSGWLMWMFVSVVEMIHFAFYGNHATGLNFADPKNLGFRYFVGFTPMKLFITLLTVFIVFVIFYIIFMHNLNVQNALADTSDINQYHNDQHIALPEEIQRKFDYFPDVGATSDVVFSSMISHIAFQNKGIKNIQVAQRAPADIKDEDGEIVLYKGEILHDDNGEILFEEKPMFDTDFANDLFTASFMPDERPDDIAMRKYYDATEIPYNPGNKNRDKLKNKEKPYNTVADLINNDWEFPYYEPQRPGGAYLVDTAPVNTMVLAITRAGKGITTPVI